MYITYDLMKQADNLAQSFSQHLLQDQPKLSTMLVIFGYQSINWF